MDLTFLKWPIIILVIAGIAFLFTSPGVNFLVNHYTKATVGADFAKDLSDESGLTRIGGYLLFTWQYQKAYDTMNLAVARYGPEGRHYYYNLYRMARCLDRLERYRESYNILMDLISANAHDADNRVADNDNLRLRASKLKEVHGL
ncbi:MAG TPA: hypothetical protein PLQ42_11045 [Candidatus Hydrogenedentes bacterium]|jgi:hypothetical protein|nr:MAG: hypothetical protein BWY07_02278 [Candidatus Hydrogenedentes bacterium ADurb.Bin170]HNZ49263.1 hypothetical protein [Candidatus Hydrogenedentota bacterium]HOD96213.1 hypothetical protein [Candidatus Hydrogenedentota bacterium]HOM47307.1 hypothetical protein [Candidatus Hydrogenedentota bacterium]HOR51606.1 hypothetical protein [Candidatus Hydrogenedentota bacterium]